MGSTVGLVGITAAQATLTLIFAGSTMWNHLDLLVKLFYTDTPDPTSTISVYNQLPKTPGCFALILLTSYITTGMVEQGMKYILTVRIKKLTPGFRDREGFLLYAVTAAVGFSTVEGIGFIFENTESLPTIIFNVLSRILVGPPCHAAFAYLMAIGVVRRDVYGESLPLWRIMLWPVLLHGSFNFPLSVAMTLMAEDWALVVVKLLVVAIAFPTLALVVQKEMKYITRSLLTPNSTTASGDPHQASDQPVIVNALPVQVIGSLEKNPVDDNDYETVMEPETNQRGQDLAGLRYHSMH